MKIYSIHYNKPEYIDLQKDFLDKYLKIEFDLVIVDNSIDTSIKSQIKEKCERLKIEYINTNNNIDSMDSKSHQNAFNYIKGDINDGDTLMILDHDIFLIDYLDIDYYHNYDMVYLPQPRGLIEYPWPGMIIFNKIKNKNDLNFSSGVVEGEACDTGGFLYYYIIDNNIKTKIISESHQNIIENDYSLLMSKIDNKFIHLISGSDWNKNYNLNSKLDILKNNYLL